MRVPGHDAPDGRRPGRRSGAQRGRRSSRRDLRLQAQDVAVLNTGPERVCSSESCLPEACGGTYSSSAGRRADRRQAHHCTNGNDATYRRIIRKAGLLLLLPVVSATVTLTLPTIPASQINEA